MAKCPQCDENVVQADIEVITLSDETMGSWRGLAYSYPGCHYVLSVGFDPVSRETDLVDRIAQSVVAALRKG